MTQQVNRVYVGGGYSSSQLIWLIPIVDGYCQKQQINRIIFEKKIPEYILNNNIIEPILYRYNIVFLKNNLVYKNIFFLIKFFLENLLKIFFYSLILNRKKLLNQNYSWYKIQIFHSIWDTSFFYLKDGELNPSFYSRTKAAFRVYYNIFCALLLKKYNTKTIFVTHCVYTHRALVATLRNYNVKIINCDTNCTVFIQPNKKDLAWNMPNKNIVEKFSNKFFFNLSDKYWRSRIQGLGNYEDAQIALKGRKINNEIYPNVIMMHIFRDSPFNIIDRSRIFADYIDWIYNTLKIIENSKEKWLIKGHPNFKRWGENSEITFNNIYNKIIKDKKNNIKFSLEKISNIDLLKNTKRLVTFSGTAHLEFACLGRKPVVISKCTLDYFDKTSVLKPKNISEYKNFLLDNSDSNYFLLDDAKKEKAKFFLYLRENIINFRRELKCISVYRNDNQKYIKKNLMNLKKNLNKNKKYLSILGEMLKYNTFNAVTKKFVSKFY